MTTLARQSLPVGFGQEIGVTDVTDEDHELVAGLMADEDDEGEPCDHGAAQFTRGRRYGVCLYCGGRVKRDEP